MTEDLAIRQTVRAVIRRGPLVLVQVKRRANGQRDLTLPGARLETGETMQACLARECLAEIGIVPQVGDVCHVADVVRTRRVGARRSILAGSSSPCPDLPSSTGAALAPHARTSLKPAPRAAAKVVVSNPDGGKRVRTAVTHRLVLPCEDRWRRLSPYNS